MVPLIKAHLIADPAEGEEVGGLLAGGRKFAISGAFLLLGFLVVVFAFVLALQGKISSDYVSIASMFFIAGGGVIGGFQWTNMKITTKTAETSRPTAAPIDPDRPPHQQPTG